MKKAIISFLFLDIKEEKKEEVVRKYRVFHMKEFYNTYSSPLLLG